MSIAAEANFSDLIQRPTDTIARLRGAPRLRLHRRGTDEDLVVTTAARYDQESAVLAASARMLARLTLTSSDLVADVILAAFPWARFLPESGQKAFAEEFADLLEASSDLDNLVPVWQLIIEWKHTAEVYADPELAAVLSQDADDFGPVPPPIAA